MLIRFVSSFDICLIAYETNCSSDVKFCCIVFDNRSSPSNKDFSVNSVHDF